MKKAFTISIILFIHQLLLAQASGTIDSTFGIKGSVITSISEGDDPRAIITQNDGKILVAGGGNNNYPDPSFMVLIRYNIDGSIDNTFGTNGKILTIFDKMIARIWRIVLQDDGKILVGGHVGAQFALLRYNSNGSLDTSFGNNGKVTTAFDNTIESEILVMAIQTDGKIVAAGYNYTKGKSSFEPNFAIARYQSNGILDTTFNATGKILLNVDTSYASSIWVRSIVIQNDNKIIIGGLVTNLIQNLGYRNDAILLKYNTNGTLDKLFGENGILRVKESNATDIKVFNNGSFLFTSGQTIDKKQKRTLNKHNELGLLDNNFGINGKIDIALNGQIALQNNNKIIVLGIDDYLTTRPLVIERFTPDGTSDNQFGTNGQAFLPIDKNESNITTTIQNDSKILVLTYFIKDRKRSFKITRYNNENLDKPIVENPLLSIYPNPNNGLFTIDFKQPIKNSLDVKIFDVLGRLMYERHYDTASSILNFNIEHLVAGSYIVNLKFDDKNTSRVIVKY